MLDVPYTGGIKAVLAAKYNEDGYYNDDVS